MDKEPLDTALDSLSETALLVKKERDIYRRALEAIATGEGAYGWQAHEYKQIAKTALAETDNDQRLPRPPHAPMG